MGDAYGGSTGSGYWRVYMVWSGYDSGNPKTWRIAVNVYRNALKSDSTGYDARSDTTTIYIDGNGDSGTPNWNHSSDAGQNRWLWGWSYDVSRTHSARYAGISGSNSHPGSHTMSGSSTATGSEYVPAKPSYAVIYNANGGTGTIANQTKWYDESLGLSDGTGFTRPHHTLLGWNTQADGQGTHYDLGATYTGNTALNLYAEWKLNCVQTCTKVQGEIKKGILYTKVNGEIKIPYAGFVKVDGHWKQIKET